ncbi:PepSY domain-containing protein [Psychrobacter sp. Arc29]|uniref:PepSY domain-containing protein n=1 Tax=Psychrobacter sp. Arc29 TaxID=3046690 RepID=UPI00352FC868
MSLPLLRPVLLTVSATSLVFFGGVIALAVQSPESAVTSLSPDLIAQNTNIKPNDLSSSMQQLPLAALTPAQATALAKQDAPNAILQANPELINYNGTVAYEVLLDNSATYIDANLGTVLNPVATNNYRVETVYKDYDDDDQDEHHDDDGDEGEKAGKYRDEDYKKNGYLIATSYKHHEEEGDYDD